ncbi:alpha/beta fold hydrolase, partial [Streptomyces sp. NPDC057654]|uniref:alpha/beta fold hydrolase n=1 Tax=Streptomyces sp. NPDC057654 TaxID=3346196 RepID=UPI0036CB30E3
RLYAPLAAALAPRHRLIALDQRGHGLSEGGGPFSTDEYAADAAALIEALGVGPLPVVGHSMGGLIAYALAALRPELVRALVIEDMGAVNQPPEVAHAVLDVSDWPVRAAGREALGEAITARGIPDPAYFLDSAEPDGDGWRLLFDPAEMMESQHATAGDHWHRWLGSSCPALLLHGEQSFMLSAAHAREMAERRPGVELVEFPGCGHWLHDDDPAGYERAVASYLNGL